MVPLARPKEEEGIPLDGNGSLEHRPLVSDSFLSKLEHHLGRRVRALPLGRPKRRRSTRKRGAAGIETSSEIGDRKSDCLYLFKLERSEMEHPRRFRFLSLLMAGTLALSGCAEVIREQIVAGVIEAFKLEATQLVGTAFDELLMRSTVGRDSDTSND